MKYKAIGRINSYNNGHLYLVFFDSAVKACVNGIVKTCQEKHGGYVKIEIQPPYKQRTIPENKRWWKMCTEYANYCGSTKDEVAMGVKWRACDEGLWELVDVPFSKTGRKEPKSTADADTKEMAILMDVLERIASEDGYIFEN